MDNAPCTVIRLSFQLVIFAGLLLASCEQAGEEGASAGPPYDEVDEILARLEWASVAFNAPQTMNLDETATIELILGREPVDSLKVLLTHAGRREGAHIRVSDRMEAMLRGDEFKFKITAITPELQAVANSERTVWRWSVRPLRGGDHTLYLSLVAWFTVAGETTPRSIKTFERTIHVEVTWRQKMASFFSNNWQWLWAVVVLPVLAWLLRRFHRRKRPATPWEP